MGLNGRTGKAAAASSGRRRRVGALAPAFAPAEHDGHLGAATQAEARAGPLREHPSTTDTPRVGPRDAAESAALLDQGALGAEQREPAKPRHGAHRRGADDHERTEDGGVAPVAGIVARPDPEPPGPRVEPRTRRPNNTFLGVLGLVDGDELLPAPGEREAVDPANRVAERDPIDVDYPIGRRDPRPMRRAREG